MKLAYYPGCSGKGTSEEYERSTQVVCSALGISLEEIKDWSCCGSTPAHAYDHTLSAALCARNLSLVSAKGEDRLATPCPSCLSNLRHARHRILENERFRERVDRLLEEPVSDALPQTVSVLQVLVEDYGIETIKKQVKQPLMGLKVACYYGCLMSRPADVMDFDNPENPMALDNLMTALGADPVPFSMKTECCGAAHGIPRRDITSRLSAKLLETARDFGAQAVVVACPLCHMNLDLRQSQAEQAGKTTFDMPVFYYTQLLGPALGFSADELGIGKLCVSPTGLLLDMKAAQIDARTSAKDKEAQA